MNRLKKTLIISTFILSAIFADMSFCSPAFAQSKEARDLNRKGADALDSGRYADSIQFLKQAMALEPTWGEPCYNAARLLKAMGKREDMIKMLRKANGVEPNNPKYQDEYIKALTEDYQNAELASNNSEKERIINEIFRVNPGNLTFGIKSVENKIQSGDKDEAAALAENILAKNTTNRSNYKLKGMGELYLIVAQVAYEKGDLEKAKSNADYAARYEFDKRDEAYSLLKKVKNDIDEKVKNLISEATNAQKSGNHSKAMSLLQEAEKYQPDNETVKNTMVEFVDEVDINKLIEVARKANANGRWLDARETLVMLTEKYPGDKTAKSMLEELKTKEKAILKQLDIPEIPLKAKDRERVMNDYKNRGIKFFELNNYKDCISPFKMALVLIDADKDLSKYKPEIEKYLERINTLDEYKKNWIKAKDAREAGDYEDVIHLLNTIPEEHQDVQHYSYLAEALYNLGNTEDAEKYARKQLGNQPENNRAKFVLGCIKLDAEDNEGAHKYFYEIYESDPEYPGLGDKLAKSSVKYWPKVLFYTVIILLSWIAWIMYKKLPIYNKDAKIRTGKRYFKKECYDEAINVLMEVRHSPYLTSADSFEITKLFAQCYLKKGAYDKAIGECKHLISITPKSEEAHTWLGYAYLGRRMLSPEALPELLNLYKKDSRNIALVSLLGSYYAQQKVISNEGIAVLEQWLNLDYDNIEVLKPLGKHYLHKGASDDKAMKVFQRMMEIGSPDPDFMLGVANVYLKKKQYDNCLQICEQVINMDINNAYVHTILLDAYKKQNRLSELLDIYANFLKNNPYNVAFQNGLRAAQAEFDKIQKRNAAQAAKEAAAVMENMRLVTQEESPGQTDNETPVQNLEPGAIACPNCGNGNPQGSYVCQFCGANLMQ